MLKLNVHFRLIMWLRCYPFYAQWLINQLVCDFNVIHSAQNLSNELLFDFNVIHFAHKLINQLTCDFNGIHSAQKLSNELLRDFILLIGEVMSYYVQFY